MSEACDSICESDLVGFIEFLCRCNGLPTDGWKIHFYNSPGPECLRRYEDGIRTHTAYVQPSCIDVYIEGGLKPIVSGGLA